MLISLINLSRSITTEEALRAVRATNRQILEDFYPYWSFGAELRLDGATGTKMRTKSAADLRGDAMLYLADGGTAKGIEGMHTTNYRDIPYGMVFVGLCKQLNDPWTATLSHEVLELIGDPMQNLMVQGPHPLDRRHKVFHLFEMCDAVQTELYEIDGVQLSNFVLPSYFTEHEQEGRRNDFLGRTHGGKSLRSFGMNPGGYLNVMNPKTDVWSTPSEPADTLATERKKVKATSHGSRSYRRLHS